jgi:hypothetical protein
VVRQDKDIRLTNIETEASKGRDRGKGETEASEGRDRGDNLEVARWQAKGDGKDEGRDRGKRRA